MKPCRPARVALLLVTALAACVSSAGGARDALDGLAVAMTGTFSSRAQHLAAPDHYYDIRLVMVPIWSERGGASYATSEVELDSVSLASWDRGFDEAGVQVWGATEGPYVFDRLSDVAPG